MKKQTTATLLHQHFDLLVERLPKLPKGVDWLMPLKDNPETARLTKLFLDKYYTDEESRTLILGINPGRFGAGLTNVAFTDPKHLEEVCGIPNEFPKRYELSAIYIYQMIERFGGVKMFYDRFFVSSVVPFGFVKAGINYNYYDDKVLQKAMEPYIKLHLSELLKIGMNANVCFCLGTGKNYKYLDRLNQKEGYFDKVVPLAHPRYIMQYKRKKLEEYLLEYVEQLQSV